ncbi:4-alpha-glucanotransferase [Shewanella colwelliana]|uniref:4-alpha-glucanotransferase n=1 Tax=Shewanella colwelliana TaxID=23 RepID=A0A1E5IQR8_SHECO|nr:4-alpha-glucanotransferase [Shewanella colwelliana]OEG72892.1 4-alpha-glucanotransferase [Shewanella colwelliana]
MGLEKLLYLQGVGAGFVDNTGHYSQTPESARVGILSCMLANEPEQEFALGQLAPDQFEATNHEAIAKRIELLDAAPWRRILPEFQHGFIDNPKLTIMLAEGDNRALMLTLTTEKGASHRGLLTRDTLHCTGDYVSHGQRFYRYQLSLHDWQTSDCLWQQGYHTVVISLADECESTACIAEGTLLLAPRQAYQFQTEPQSNTQAKRPWGVSIQLYSLRSQRQWGIGDFGDLRQLINWSAASGCDFIQLNPLHGLQLPFSEAQLDVNRLNISPYSPSDRRRINPLYIDVSEVAEYPKISDRVAALAINQMRLNRDNWLDYPGIITTKYALFSDLYMTFVADEYQKNTLRYSQFSAFVEQEGLALIQYCQFEANRATSGVLADERFHQYLQFVAHEQLLGCQQQAHQAGMRIGLIGDMAVGASGCGAEVNFNLASYCQGASIGAPADEFAPQGQNWGLTPFDPIGIKHRGYEHFIQLIRSNMRYYGALRIDHVMALMRLWWWPQDEVDSGGAYVYYPMDTLLAIVCIESQRAACMVIGEDLGTVPPELRATLAQCGIYSNELFYFCRNEHGFMPPNEHKPHSLMMLANHDVPNLAAWWSQSDLHLRRQLWLIDSDAQLDIALASRDVQREQLLSLLKLTSGFTGNIDSEFAEILEAWMTTAAQSSSSLFSVQLVDLCCERYAVNIPGTWQEYANWQRRLPYTIEALSQSPAINRLLHRIRCARSDAPVTTQPVTDTIDCHG